jgi:hypothetical protein
VCGGDRETASSAASRLVAGSRNITNHFADLSDLLTFSILL